MNRTIDNFFDFASATPLDSEVLGAMSPFLTMDFANPSALYSASESPKHAIEQSRKDVALLLGVKPREIIFTSGCTEANNLAISGVRSAYPNSKVLVSSVEHDSVLRPAKEGNHDIIPVLPNGVIDLDALESLITDDVVLVSVMYINNETGVVQPLRKLSQIIESIHIRRGKNGLPIYLHTDAAQAPCISPIVRSALGVDLMSLNGGKIYGPKGSGCLYASSDVLIEPLFYGGGQERGIRSGTENIASIVGFAESLKRSTGISKDESERLRILQNQLVKGIQDIGGEVVGLKSPRSPAITSVIFKGIDNERMVYALDLRGFSVSSGSACHARSGEKSHVLKSMGYDDESIMSSLRISFGRYTTDDSVSGLLENLKELLASL